MNSLFGSIAAFVAVLALIPLALWLLKRSPMGSALGGVAGGTGGAGAMRLISALALAPNQRLVTVEVGSGDERRWLVLGVTPAGIHTLHTLTPQHDATPAAAPATPFAQSLSQVLGRFQQGKPGSGDGR
ncbi:MAG: flagellar biosynthetic protein FliO [Burkholderiaceae bacterium]|nr:flagellar biosynthetic protein FliO [Burkholderiaceae bacterium]